MAGVRDRQHINPDNWNLDQYLLDRPENAAAQLELFYNYRKNLERYPEWHEYTVQVLSTPHNSKDICATSLPWAHLCEQGSLVAHPLTPQFGPCCNNC